MRELAPALQRNTTAPKVPINASMNAASRPDASAPHPQPNRPTRRSIRAALAACVGVLTLLASACSSSGEGTDTSGTCTADDAEPNDTDARAKDLGELSAPETTRTLTSTSADDVDWFRAHVTDDGVGDNPAVTVQVPEDYELTTWFVCDNPGGDGLECQIGTASTEALDGTSACEGTAQQSSGTDGITKTMTDCLGSDDSGTLYIRVRRRYADADCTYVMDVRIN